MNRTEIVEAMARAIADSFADGSPDIAADLRMDTDTWLPEGQAALDALAAQGLCVVPVEGLQRIADATDLYEPCGWAVHSVRAMLAVQGGV